MPIVDTIRKIFGVDYDSRVKRENKAKLAALEESQTRARTEIEKYRVQLEDIGRQIDRKREAYAVAVGAQKELLKRELAALLDEQRKSEMKRDAIFRQIETNNTLIANLQTLLVQGTAPSIDDMETIRDAVEAQKYDERQRDRVMDSFEKSVVTSALDEIDVDAELAKLDAQTASVQVAAADELKTALPSVDELEKELAQTRAQDEAQALSE